MAAAAQRASRSGHAPRGDGDGDGQMLSPRPAGPAAAQCGVAAADAFVLTRDSPPLTSGARSLAQRWRPAPPMSPARREAPAGTQGCSPGVWGSRMGASETWLRLLPGAVTASQSQAQGLGKSRAHKVRRKISLWALRSPGPGPPRAGTEPQRALRAVLMQRCSGTDAARDFWQR